MKQHHRIKCANFDMIMKNESLQKKEEKKKFYIYFIIAIISDIVSASQHL